jgi:hypothetical protein
MMRDLAKDIKDESKRLLDLCVLIQKEMAPNMTAGDLWELYFELDMKIDKDIPDLHESLLSEVGPLVKALREDWASFLRGTDTHHVYNKSSIYDFLASEKIYLWF